MARQDLNQSGQAAGAPQKPADLTGASWWGVLKRTAAEFQADNLTDKAAALTYYGLMSVFPALLAVVSVLGVVGRSVTGPLVGNLRTLSPGPGRQILTTVLEQVQHNRSGAGIALIAGIALAVWSASGYIAAFMRAANDVYDIGEGRPVWKTIPTRLAVTVVMVVLLAFSAVMVVLTGALANRAGQILGIGRTAILIWDIAKWPVLLVLVSVMFALLYWAAPNVKRGFRWVTPGSILAVAVWLIASAAFGVYLATFASYNKTYGSLAGIIVFLVWLWISNTALLLGLEFNAEIERGRAIQGGHPAGKEPYIQPRDTRKL